LFPGFSHLPSDRWRWVWSIGGMILMVETEVLGEKEPCHSTTLLTASLQTDLRSWPGFRRKDPADYRRSHYTVCLKFIYR
jgi:hypothetical protein